MEVEGNQSSVAELPTDSSIPRLESHAVQAETEIETPLERIEDFHSFSDVPSACIGKR